MASANPHLRSELWGTRLAMLNASDKAGAGVFLAISVTASVLTSLALDHWALMGFKQHTASFPA